MSYVGQVKKGSTTHLVGSTLYGTCSTAAGTAAKVGTLANFDALLTGVTVHLKMTNSNTVASPTLNVNGTGAKPITKYGTTAVGTSATTSWYAGSIVSFTYDGTSWVINDYKENTNTTYTAGRFLELSGTQFRVKAQDVYAPVDNFSLASGTQTSKDVWTSPADGKIFCTITATFSANATGSRLLRLQVTPPGETTKGAGSTMRLPACPTGGTQLSCTIFSQCNTGTVISALLEQNSGSAITVSSFQMAGVFLTE